MKVIYLHIGTHKTGSTSIQRFLAQAKDALSKQGILYPQAGRPDTEWSNQYGQHELARSISGEHDVDEEQVWTELRREINECNGQRVVLSTEEFEGRTSEEIQRIVSHLEPHPIRVVVYLRSPVHYLRSQYKQLVKTGKYSASFVRFVEDMGSRCNYLGLVSRWEQFDEVESVDIRLFDKVKNDPGIEPSFADAVGVDFEEVRSFVGSPVNTSPRTSLVRMARWINVLRVLWEENETWRTLTNRARRNVLSQRWPGTRLASLMEPFLRDSLVTDRAVDLVREEIGDVHERFLEEYVDPDDWSHLAL